MSFKFMATIAALIAAVLAVMYGFLPDVVYWIFSVPDGGETGDFISRRAATLFLGFAVLLWSIRDAPKSALRRSICLAVTVLTGVIALLGLFEILRGFSGGLHWGVVGLELALMAGFGRLWIRGG